MAIVRGFTGRGNSLEPRHDRRRAKSDVLLPCCEACARAQGNLCSTRPPLSEVDDLLGGRGPGAGRKRGVA